ncbi:GFA family protein [Paracoccus sp. S1E-3]|uniref:GFA family protein n=1 Tax=Paracoccus sp. S1E-3 TaxID=2756130 RepID=UPI0015EEE691|nr:GFA family protein [Paracoccus sp. S1E-3]MBA4490863.1 GFA family protein [Paracoccus sp. S1E-3]
MLTGSCHCGRLHWRFDTWPDGATLCNCTICRRYGVLWIYGHEGEDVALTGDSHIYKTSSGWLEFHFCPDCGCIAAWRGVHLQKDGRRRLAVNLRLSEDQDIIRPIPLDLFDGLDSFTDLSRDGRTVGDVIM